MKNEYEIRGNVTAIFLKSKKYGDKETLIDTKNLHIAQGFTGTWYANFSYNSKDAFYVQGCYMVNRKSHMLILHRLITGAPKGMVVDHKNHNTLNNTEENLRVVTTAQNNQNVRQQRKNISKSNVRGVNPIGRKWQAVLRVNGKNIYLGLFSEIKDAEAVVIEARKKYLPYSCEAS